MFKIRDIPEVNPQDVRGWTREWKQPGGHQITIYRREPGVEFGGHFHKGDDPSKNPEKILVIVGAMELIFGDESVIVSEGQEIIIYPETPHSARVVGDKEVIYIEYRNTHFDKDHPDTYPIY